MAELSAALNEPVDLKHVTRAAVEEAPAPGGGDGEGFVARKAAATRYL
jgi:hypothetical protein